MVGSATFRDFTKVQCCRTLSSEESECCAAVTTTAEALHSNVSWNSRDCQSSSDCGSTERQHAASSNDRGAVLSSISTRLLWPQSEHEERKSMVREPTQTNTADAFTKALQAAKYLEWRNRRGIGFDSGDEVDTSNREALAEITTMGTSRSFACDPTLSVDRDLDAANVCHRKTWMERLEMVEQGFEQATCAAVADGWRVSCSM